MRPTRCRAPRPAWPAKGRCLCPRAIRGAAGGRKHDLPGRPRVCVWGSRACLLPAALPPPAPWSWVTSCRLAAVACAARGMPPPSVSRWSLVPALPGSAGVLPVLSPPRQSTPGRGVCRRPAPVDLVGVAQFGQKHRGQSRPDAALVPLVQAHPARRARTAAHLTRQVVPRQARLDG